MSTATITINSNPYTIALVSATGSYTGSSLSGIYMITGEVVLNATPSLAVAWDDRYNPDFQRGKQVKIIIDGSEAPIIGTTYVLSARYKPEESLVKISVGCILALLNSRTPQDLAICVTAEEGVTIQKAVDLLLSSAGVTSKSISITNGQKLLEPLLLGESQGLINTAAQLTASSGYFLWQDKTGIVRTQTMVPSQGAGGANLMLKSRLDMERLNETELPYTQVIIRGAKREMVELPDEEDVSESTEFSFTQSNTKTVKIFRDFTNRTITTVTEEEFGDFVNITEVLEEYEPIPNIEALNDQIASPSECLPPDEGRLVQRTTTFIQNAELATLACKATWEESAKVVEDNSDPPKQAFFQVSGNIFPSVITETWEYNISPAVIEDSKTTVLSFGNPGSGNISVTPGSSSVIGASTDETGTKDTVIYEKTTQEVRGIAAPIICHWTYGNNELLADNADLALPPSGILNTSITEVETITWKKNKDNQWYGERLVERANVKVDPNRFTSAALAADDLTALGPATNGLFTRKIIVREQKNDWTPPDPGRFPPRYTIDETDYERIFIISGFGSSQEERIKVVNLDVFGNVDETTQKVGRAHGLQSWGKNKGSRITSVFYNVDRPMARVDVYNDTVNFKGPYNLESFYIDNPSIALTRNDTAFSGVALFISADSNAPSPDVDVLVSAGGGSAYFNGTDYCTFVYTPVSVDLTDARYNFEGFGTDGELGPEAFYTDLNTGNRIISEPVSGAILEETIEVVTSFTSVNNQPRGDFFINENGDIVDSLKNSLVPPFTPLVGAIVTKLNQTGSCSTGFTTAQVTEPLVCTKYLFTPTFQVFYPATHIAEACTRELGSDFSSEIKVVGDQELVPLFDAETNSMVAYPC